MARRGNKLWSGRIGEQPIIDLSDEEWAETRRLQDEMTSRINKASLIEMPDFHRSYSRVKAARNRTRKMVRKNGYTCKDCFLCPDCKKRIEKNLTVCEGFMKPIRRKGSALKGLYSELAKINSEKVSTK